MGTEWISSYALERINSSAVLTALPVSLERLQPIAGRCSQVSYVRGIVEVDQLSPGYPAKLGGEQASRLASSVVEQILGQGTAECFDHVPVLSEHDNNNRPRP